MTTWFVLSNIGDNPAQGLKFLAMGDWGDGQATTGAKIGKFMNEEGKGATVVLAIGDNFYDRGVKSVNDTQFQTTYRDVFTGDNLKRTPFLVVAGNHDYYGNVQAQIDYATQDPTKRWYFPSFYYTKLVEQDGVRVFFVMVDTWRLNGGDYLLGTDGSRVWIKSEAALQHAVKHETLSPESARMLRRDFVVDEQARGQPDMKQWAWLKRVLFSNEANTSDWTVVVGHFAVHSASKFEHGDTPSLVRDLEPLLRAANVPVYMNGHDHILQHIKMDDGPTHYYGSGAGGKKHSLIFDDYDGLLGHQIGMYGFTKHEVSKTEFKTTFYASVNGTKKNTYSYTQKRAGGVALSRLRGGGGNDVTTDDPKPVDEIADMLVMVE
jgi:hypothetical protein